MRRPRQSSAALMSSVKELAARALIGESAIDPTRFERNLGRLLDGFAAEFAGK